uniref:Uncharacterized protein n=1 Tax=Manihot esculenta TaxID=3983 RepID=A0A2C9VE99_MANES
MLKFQQKWVFRIQFGIDRIVLFGLLCDGIVVWLFFFRPSSLSPFLQSLFEPND